MTRPARVLLVDPMCQSGHLAFNRTYIDRLRELGVSLDLAIAPDYAEALGVDVGLVPSAFPSEQTRIAAGPVTSRRLQLATLRDLRRRVDLRSYDHVVLSSYDEFTLALAHLPVRLWLVNHANIGGLSSPVKRVFLRAAARRGTFIVPHAFIAARCAEFGIHDVRVETIGLAAPFTMEDATRLRTLAALDPRLAPGRFQHLLFAPATRHTSSALRDALADPTFQQFLTEHQVVCVARERVPVTSPNVVILDRWLTDLEYRSLLLSASGIWLHYSPAFQYRVSALLFECFANARPCVVPDIPAFRAFAPHFTYPALYADVAALPRILTGMWAHAAHVPFRDLDALRTPSLTYLATP